MFRIALHSLGCRTNQVETEALRTELEGAGENLHFVSWSEVADVYVLNSCTVTARADRQARQRIHRAHRLAPDAPIVVAGCYAESNAGVVAGLSGVAAVVGPGRRAQLASVVRASLQGRLEPETVHTGGFEGLRELPGHRVTDFARRTRAPIKVQEGCDHRCSYCIVPSVRGASRSLPIDVAVEDARRLASAGHPEIVIAGTHIGRWGRDLEPASRLVDLLRSLLARVDGPRFRLSSLDPHEVDDGLLEMLRDEPRLCRHLHLTLQHCDPGVLVQMGRRAPRDGFGETLARIRGGVPRIGLGADVIAGFPGESRDTFDAMLRILGDAPLTYLHAFGYSPRPGTPAAGFDGQVARDERRSRVAALRSLSEDQLAPAFARELVGQRVEVAVEREGDGGGMRGTSSEFVTVQLPEVPEQRRGELVSARVVDTCGTAAIATCAAGGEGSRC